MSDFSLIALIRKVIEETDLASPTDLADKVAEMVPPKQVRAALAEALPYLVQTELGRQRMSSKPAPNARRVANPSAKLRGLRDYADAWRSRLRDRVSVGSGGEWKLLADCTAMDFRHAAGYRRALAAGNLAHAEEFDAYAAALDEHKVSRFADLPEPVQAEMLGGGQEKAA